MNIGFGKISMKKSLVILKIKLRKETNWNKTKRKKPNKVLNGVYTKTYRQSKWLFLSKITIGRTAGGTEPSGWKRNTCSPKIKHGVKCARSEMYTSFLENPCQALSVISSLKWHYNCNFSFFFFFFFFFHKRFSPMNAFHMHEASVDPSLISICCQVSSGIPAFYSLQIFNALMYRL